jgi:hypothetical protein
VSVRISYLERMLNRYRCNEIRCRNRLRVCWTLVAYPGGLSRAGHGIPNALAPRIGGVPGPVSRLRREVVGEAIAQVAGASGVKAALPAGGADGGWSESPVALVGYRAAVIWQRKHRSGFERTAHIR